MRTLAVLGVVLAARVVAADPEPRSAVPDGRGDGDGYCDYVRGAASARAAVLIAPTVFGQFGLVEQTTNAVTPETSAGGLRLIAGVRVNLDGIYKGLATRDRALADCHRHTALERVRGETAYQALDARARVLDGALAETDKILGLHMIGPDAPEILQAAAVAVKAGLTKQAFDDTVALHPSMAEELVLLR